MDTRLLRYFAAVAAEGNLTRAAERLYVSQPALTKQVKQLERELGVELFARSKSGMALTGPGRVLADRVPGLLEGWDLTQRAVKAEAARQAKVLRIGFLASAANEATPKIIAGFAKLRPQWRVEMRQSSWSDPTAGLAGGEVDAALVRLPFAGQEHWNLEELLTEPRCVAMEAAHPLAERPVLDFLDLLDEPFVAAPAETGEWRDYWLAVSQRGGHPARIGAVTEHPDDWLSAIANGYGIALAPESASRFYARPGIVYRPVNGIPPTKVALAWPDDPGPVLRDFIETCRAAAR